MDSELDNRKTRIDFSAVPDTKQSSKSTSTLTPLPSKVITDTASKPKKRKASSPKGPPVSKALKAIDGPTSNTGNRDLVLIKAAEAGVSSLEYIPLQQESPWGSLRKVYELELDGFVTVASQRAFPHRLVTVKLLEGSGVDRKFRLLQEVRHRNFQAVLECFGFQGCRYVVFEHVSISLSHVTKSPPYLSKLELAAILAQLLNGLAYLASKGLEHGSLTCSNILLSDDGEIKITGQESCREIEPAKQLPSGDVRAVGYITMELMQKYAKDDGAIGIDDLDRWPSESDPVGFLSMTTSATSVNELLQHRLLQVSWKKEDLRWIAALAGVSADRGFKYREN